MKSRIFHSILHCRDDRTLEECQKHFEVKLILMTGNCAIVILTSCCYNKVVHDHYGSHLLANKHFDISISSQFGHETLYWSKFSAFGTILLLLCARFRTLFQNSRKTSVVNESMIKKLPCQLMSIAYFIGYYHFTRPICFCILVSPTLVNSSFKLRKGFRIWKVQ